MCHVGTVTTVLYGEPSQLPSVLGREMSFSASTRAMVSRFIFERGNAVLGFGASFILRGFFNSPVFYRGLVLVLRIIM